MGGIRELGVRGLSVTIPFKTQILPYLDQHRGGGREDQSSQYPCDGGPGKLVGYNTDCCGAVEALEEKIDLQGKRVILFGAGGAARAIGFGLKEKGCRVVIFNRSRSRAEVLAKELGCTHHPLSSLREMVGDVLVNATSVGMHPLDTESPVPKEILGEGMVVMDIVYKPLQDQTSAGS